MPNLAAAPVGPNTRPRLSLRAASIMSFSCARSLRGSSRWSFASVRSGCCGDQPSSIEKTSVFHYSCSEGKRRVFHDQVADIAFQIAERRAEELPTFKEDWEVREYLEKKGFFTREERKGFDGVYGLLSSGTHRKGDKNLGLARPRYVHNGLSLRFYEVFPLLR